MFFDILYLLISHEHTFSHHFNEKMAIANKGIGLIKFLSSYCPITTLDQIYKMYVIPHLDYCDVIYNNPFIVNEFDA